MLEDNASVNTETADAKSQQTTVAVAAPPNLKIKVHLTIIQYFCALTTLPVYSASIITTHDGEAGSTGTLDPRSSPSRARSWLIASNGLGIASL